MKATMTALIGKTISYYNGFNGSNDYFTIGHAEETGESIRVRVAEGKGWGVYIPKSIVKDLLKKGLYEEWGSLEGCNFVYRWRIMD
jgi:hypothetical protein